MYRQFGWFIVAAYRGRGLHQLARADLGDFWSHLYGQRRLCRGSLYPPDPNYPHFWLDMWVTQTKRRTHEQGG
jgi:hypothetical protein